MGEYPEANRDEREDFTSAGRPQGWTKTFFLETLSIFFQDLCREHWSDERQARRRLVALLYKPTNVHISKSFISDH